ncbi:MAG: MFS transporter [Verrucomicrobiaceae bacterium]|nr:MFS transporter [Verrucomicrobiaceae bacterium]
MPQELGKPLKDSRLWIPTYPFNPARWPFFYGWVIVAMGTLAVVFSIPGQTMGFSVFTDILIHELGLSRVSLSTAYCVGTVASGFTLPFFGRLYDRIGARRMIFYSALVTGLVLFYLSQVRLLLDGLDFLTGAPRTVLAFGLITLGFYMIRASAQGVLTMTGRNAIGKWFDYHRGTAFALSGLITSFAFSFAPRGLRGMIDHFGWSQSWLILGVLTMTWMAGIGWLLVRDNPEECGLLMDGGDGKRAGRAVHDDALTHRDFTRSEALRTWPFWVFNLSFGFISLYTTAVTFHILSIAKQAQRGEIEVIGYFVPMAFISVFTNLLMGWMSSRTRLKYLLAIMNAGALASVIGVIHLQTQQGVVAYIVGNGIAGGCFACLSGVVWPRFFGRRWLGAISGIGMSSMVIASGIGPLLFGASLSTSGSYAPVLWGCAVVPSLLFLATGWSDNPQRKQA